jgi:hypothetical protein
MQNFSQGFLPISFSNIWIINAIRRLDQPQMELHYRQNIHTPFSRTVTTEKQPLAAFPKLWDEFPDQQIKVSRNRLVFIIALKKFLKLSDDPVCTRLLCPVCHLHLLSHCHFFHNVNK